MTINPRLKLQCVLCDWWGQAETHCAHGLEDGENPGALYFSAARVLTLEIGRRASSCLAQENLIGHDGRKFYIQLLARRAA